MWFVFFKGMLKWAQLLACVSILAACGKSYVTPETVVNAKEGVGIKGYDPVAYHAAAKPAEGNAEQAYEYAGVTYHFSTAENKNAFALAPEKYIPAYGGYCAYAMSLGNVVDINPKNWAVVDGQLYLNANGFAQALWNLDRQGNIQDANRKWSAIKTKALEPSPENVNQQ
ncbi:YHS domain-containing (seleno)protein [Kordiimonas laminariae]|uniref:YHS domain-containing (seleno)protein n=1 Tax=Kordiimonas laminariae TaxID=2917717 RepID=UPI001FF16761|nr:YHS domain-containing (seleno)protein [Kordiimonas laminariae]MCK0068283.1 YHS domain-containing protein [Kordiimonas laminariae]